MSKLHILGICGTFMGGIASIAKELGLGVSGSDQHVYPPMSTQLKSLGISLSEGFHLNDIPDDADVVVGNIMSRGNTVTEALLNQKTLLKSGPQWLHENVLKDKWVLAVSGTHGKTTTSSMLAWILEYAGLKPGFLIGGVPENFGVSSRLGESDFFVIEADEYDTAFFDKRSKFVHYFPRTLIINNLEFDHADIFDSLDDIKKQFHHLIRLVPNDGLLVINGNDDNITDTLSKGSWSEQQLFSIKSDLDLKSGLGLAKTKDLVKSNINDWQAVLVNQDGSNFEIQQNKKVLGKVNWNFLGRHNVTNALAAVIAASHVGVDIATSIHALESFKGIKRRLQVKGKIDTKQGNKITVYDDFAHHPTAIETTLDGLRKHIDNNKIFAVFEPRSNTMQMGVHKTNLASAFKLADETFIYNDGNLAWNISDAFSNLANATISDDFEKFMSNIVETVQSVEPDNDIHLVILSNGSFNGIHDKLLEQLQY